MSSGGQDGVPGLRASGLMATETEIRIERIKAVFQQAPAAVLVTVVNSTLMTAVLVTAEHDRRAYAWLAAVLLLAALRFWLWCAYHRASPERVGDRHWAMVSAYGALASGLLWGGGAVLLFPHSATYQLLWVFLIGGMCAGAAALHFAHLPTALAYIVPAALPVAARFAAVGSERGIAAAAMIVVFVAALATTSRRSSRQFGDMLRLQFDLAQRTHELDIINGRLRAEMAEHSTTETTLRHVQKMEAVGQLTGGIAHDFNNLLTAVLGSLDLLRKRVSAQDQKSLRLLDNAVQGAERGAALTQRLLAFGRRQALEPETVDVAALVRGMSDLLRSALGFNVRVETRFPMMPVSAHVDANQLELALLNLAANARDAMPDGGELTIAAREEHVGPGDVSDLPIGAYVLLSVTDSGEGMDEATLAHAAEPFFTTKGIGKGTGLGLPMVHGLAAQSGGQLMLRSRKGEGTTAELWLPRAGAQAAAPVAPEPAQTMPARRRRVLLVDDDPLVLTSTAAMLEDLGHSVVEATSGLQALEILRVAAPVDLVIADYAMPGMTGLQLADELSRLRPGLPVLLATGYAELPETAPAGLVRLGKPFGQATLARATEGCFDRPAEVGA